MIEKIITPNQTQNNNKYKDPLNNKAIMMMSYSNEIGTAISEIAPKLGTALWAPTFMYLGADIYDKYKNDKNNYDPSAKRALKRTIYQGLTSLTTIPAIIYLAQSAISPLGKLTHSGISLNAQNAVFNHIKNVIEQTHGENLENYEIFNNMIKKTLENKLHARKNEKKFNKFFNKLTNLFTDKFPMVNANKRKLLKFTEKHTRKTFEIASGLINNDPSKVPPKIYKKYQKLLPAMKEMYGNDYSHHAVRTVLKEYQNSLIFKNKILKTLVGFAALFLCANPISSYIDNKIMKQYIAPSIDNLQENFVNNSNMKRIFNEMKISKNQP